MNMSEKQKASVIIAIEDNPDHADIIRDAFPSNVLFINVSAGDDITCQPDGIYSLTEWVGNEKNEKEQKRVNCIPLSNEKFHVTEWMENENGKTEEKQFNGSSLYFIFDLRIPGEDGIKIWKKLGMPKNYVFVTMWANDPHFRSQMIAAGIDMSRVIAKMDGKEEIIHQRIKEIMCSDGVDLWG